ncbi:hypothetical protein BSG1_01780 [Bacillus sp. SG-1]|nr:hypothetical protein BSG1_01780 [Bacillus sp. SG-1]
MNSLHELAKKLTMFMHILGEEKKAKVWTLVNDKKP